MLIWLQAHFENPSNQVQVIYSFLFPEQVIVFPLPNSMRFNLPGIYRNKCLEKCISCLESEYYIGKMLYLSTTVMESGFNSI